MFTVWLWLSKETPHGPLVHSLSRQWPSACQCRVRGHCLLIVTLTIRNINDRHPHDIIRRSISQHVQPCRVQHIMLVKCLQYGCGCLPRRPTVPLFTACLGSGRAAANAMSLGTSLFTMIRTIKRPSPHINMRMISQHRIPFAVMHTSRYTILIPVGVHTRHSTRGSLTSPHYKNTRLH